MFTFPANLTFFFLQQWGRRIEMHNDCTLVFDTSFPQFFLLKSTQTVVSFCLFMRKDQWSLFAFEESIQLHHDSVPIDFLTYFWCLMTVVYFVKKTILLFVRQGQPCSSLVSPPYWQNNHYVHSKLFGVAIKQCWFIARFTEGNKGIRIRRSQQRGWEFLIFKSFEFRILIFFYIYKYICNFCLCCYC